MFNNKPELNFQEIKTKGNSQTAYRTKVPGGWFVSFGDKHNGTGGAFFYPDPNHEWDGNSLT